MGSPFGIRRRMKAMFGFGDKAEAAASTRPSCAFVLVGPGDREQDTRANVGQSLLLASGNLQVPIASGCSDSTCSTCRIEVLEGDGLLSERSDHEAATLRANDRPGHLRLACATTVKAAEPGMIRVRAFEFLE